MFMDGIYTDFCLIFLFLFLFSLLYMQFNGPQLYSILSKYKTIVWIIDRQIIFTSRADIGDWNFFDFTVYVVIDFLQTKYFRFRLGYIKKRLVYKIGYLWF